MKIKTSGLKGKQLDYAVGVATKAHICIHNGRLIHPMLKPDHRHNSWYEPSTDWSQGGPLIEKWLVDIEQEKIDGRQTWHAQVDDNGHYVEGETALMAACRAIVAAEIGDKVEVPRELA